MTKKTERMILVEMMSNEVVAQNSEWISYIEKKIAQLDAKSNKASEKRAAQSAENDKYLDDIMEVLKGSTNVATGKTIADIRAYGGELGAMTSQKILPMVRKLVAQGKVTSGIEKGRTKYFLV